MRSQGENIAIAVTIALLLAMTGCSRGADSAAAESTGATPQVDRVVAGHPQRKTLVLTTSQPARIEAYEETPLFAKLAGYVGEVHVDIGDPVKKSMPLVTLRIPELANELQQKQALLAQAEAEVTQAAANVDAVKAAAETAKARVAEAQAGVSRTEADYQRWSAELERIKRLAASGSVTQKLADETQNQLSAAAASKQEAAAAVQSAEAGAREATAMITKAAADQTAAEARLGVAQADVARAQTMLSYAEITAPFDGVVTQRTIDTGHLVQPASGSGAKPLLVVARTDKVRVFLDVPEMESGAVDVGDPATLRVQALQGRELQAAVSRTSWSLDATNRSLRAEVDVPNEESLLRPGMYATGTIELDRRENALTLPMTAIVRVGAETYCCRIESGKIDRRRIELGLRSGPEVEVLKGIDEKSLVVLARADGLAPGQEVQVIEAKP
jgi:HlyD family secretion protein